MAGGVYFGSVPRFPRGPAPGGPGKSPLPSAVPSPSYSPEPSESQTLWRVVNDPDTGMGGKRRGKNNAASQAQVGGPGTIIPIHYGLRRVGARIGAITTYGGALVLLCVWGEGEIDAVEQVYINDEAISGFVEVAHYLGTESQAVDPTLAAAFAAAGLVYADTLPGIAYTVVRVPPKKNTGFPEVSARIRGRKVSATDGGTPAYSTVPAYIIADLITSDTYGLGALVDWDDVAALATRNNATVGSPAEARNVLSVSIDQRATAEQWLVTLADYAGCIPVKEGDTYRLILDAPSSSVATIEKADVVEGSLRWESRAPAEAPTVIEVGYTDTSSTPWRDDSVFIYAPGAETGALDRRVSRVSKPGIQRYSEAYRYGVQMLNGFQTADLTVGFIAFDEAIKFLPGDVITLNAPPFSSKDFRVETITPTSSQLWTITAHEYDAAKWSDTVVAGPTTLDTGLPSPFSVTAPTGLTLAEDVYQIQTGRFGSRLRVSWTGPTRTSYIFLIGFSLSISDGTNVSTFELPYDATEFVTPALPENQLYTVTLRARSEFAESEATIDTITNNGKLALPSDIASITAYSVNGETRATWEPATDLDLTSYEIRYSDQSGTWEAATLLAFVAAPETRLVTTMVPTGDRRVWVKAHDSVRTDSYPNGQESATAAYVDLTVVASNTSVSIDYELTEGTLTNMVAYPPGGWITAVAADQWDSLFPSAMSTYTNALATYHASATSSIVSADVDGDASELCTITVEPTYTDLSGTGQIYIEHKVLIGDAWTRVNASAAVVTARYFRAGVEWTTTETGIVSDLGVLRKTIDSTDNFVQHTVFNDPSAWV